jgi:hypothetical protein
MRSHANWIRTVCVLSTLAGLGLSSHASAAVINQATLKKCSFTKFLCFSALVRCQTVADSLNHRLIEVQMVALWGPGYFIPDWVGPLTDENRGSMPREVSYVGDTRFCASGGTHNHRSDHRRQDIGFNLYETTLTKQEHIIGNPCGPID